VRLAYVICCKSSAHTPVDGSLRISVQLAILEQIYSQMGVAPAGGPDVAGTCRHALYPSLDNFTAHSHFTARWRTRPDFNYARLKHWILEPSNMKIHWEFAAVIYFEKNKDSVTSQQNQTPWLLRMPSSGMLRHVALVRTDVSEERSVSIIRVTRIGKLGTTLVVTSNRHTLRRNTWFSHSISSQRVSVASYD
jgi:hypothetical protein